MAERRCRPTTQSVVVVVLLGLAEWASAEDPSLPAQTWGVQDQTAVVGRLFELRLPGVNDNIVLQEIDESGTATSALPHWLHYDSNLSVFEGVPGAGDLRKTVTLKLVAVDAGGTPKWTDQFVVSVIEEEMQVPEEGSGDRVDSELPRPVRCLPTSAVTTATVVIDSDAEAATGRERVNTIRAFAGHLGLHVSAVRYLPASKVPVDDSSALVAGVGDAATAGHLVRNGGSVLQWEVGCGNVFAAHMDRLQRVESTASDGTMTAALGRGVVGWHVANKKPQTVTSKRQRQRRAVPRVLPSATPVVTIGPPTSRPVPTHTVKDPEPTRMPPTRVVFTTPSAVYPNTVTERRRTRRRRTRRPRPRRTTPVVGARSTTARPPPVRTLEPSVATVPTTKVVITTPPLKPPHVGSDLRWTGLPLHLDVHHNQIIDQDIPDNLFVGGSPGPLRMRLLTADGLEVSQWLRLDNRTNRLIGMPLETHLGQQMYILEATDSSGRIAKATVMVDVRYKSSSSNNVAFESSAKLGLDYDRFTDDVVLRLDVANKIAGGFGDEDASQLAVMRIASGSVVFSWTNSSVPGNTVCPVSTVVDIRARMLLSDGSVNPGFREAVRPYRLLDATMTPRGSCSNANLERIPSATTPGPQPVKPEEDTQMANVIIPVVLIIVFIIVAIIVACYLIRRRKAQKASSPDKTVKPGAPVIFASELDDAGISPPSKPLIGVNAERPPAPPDYAAATTGTPPVHDHRRPLLSDTGAEQMSPLRFQPPPGRAVKQPGVHSSSRR